LTGKAADMVNQRSFSGDQGEFKYSEKNGLAANWE
jgi:hypothetical protein